MVESVVSGVVWALFAAATGALAAYGLHLYVLVWLFRRRSNRVRQGQREASDRYCRTTSPDDWPVVTSQIPLYNERDVAGRIIRAVAAFDYPAGKHEIQVLDDSNDSSRDMVDEIVKELSARGVKINVVRRADRSGFKAGALQAGVKAARGEFLAVFDADFVPSPDFLRQAIPLLVCDSGLACLQGRWGHLNQEHSWLTRAQALGIDGHFAIEQGARAWNGLLMNFNGTAGVWRKTAIEDPRVGGWSGDTLTEDLDLSYRAQLAGWRLDYSMDLVCPAELPEQIDAFKSQQRRWATGSIQVAVKLLPRIWRAPLTLGQKLEATLHLTHYSASLWMLVLAIIARPMLVVSLRELPSAEWFWTLWAIVIASAVAPTVTYSYARWSLGGGLGGLRLVPQMIVLGCGMCVNNTLAVLRGLGTVGGEFVRTPKSGNLGGQKQRSSYAAVKTPMWIVEIALGVYSLATFGYYVNSSRWPVSIFMLLYGVGFLTTGALSKPPRAGGRSDRPDTGRVSVAPGSTPLANPVSG